MRCVLKILVSNLEKSRLGNLYWNRDYLMGKSDHNSYMLKAKGSSDSLLGNKSKLTALK